MNCYLCGKSPIECNCLNDEEPEKQIDMLDLLGMKVSFAGELYAYGTDCRKGTCD